MRFWFARNSEVPIREQVVTQVVLGILCGELTPGERLPSTREPARGFKLHANTSIAASPRSKGIGRREARAAPGQAGAANYGRRWILPPGAETMSWTSC